MPVKRLLRKISFFVPRRPETPGANGIFSPPRRHPRIPLTTDVMVRGHDVKGHDFNFTARSVQLGTQGMSLEGANQLLLAQPVELAFALPSGSSLRVGAVVWWKKDLLTGLRFDPRDEYPSIQKWIDMTGRALVPSEALPNQP